MNDSCIREPIELTAHQEFGRRPLANKDLWKGVNRERLITTGLKDRHLHPNLGLRGDRALWLNNKLNIRKTLGKEERHSSYKWRMGLGELQRPLNSTDWCLDKTNSTVLLCITWNLCSFTIIRSASIA